MGWANQAPIYVELVNTQPQDMGDTSLQAIEGMSATLTPATYRVHVRLVGVCSTVAGTTYQPGFLFTGSETSVILSSVDWLSTGEGSSPVCTNDFGVTALNGLGQSPPSVGLLQSAWTDIDGVLTVTETGLLSAAVASSAAGDNYHVFPGCVMEVVPVAA